MANVLVTGTSTGIGFSISKILASAGHQVYATMRNPDRGPELKELAESESLPIHVVTMDVDSDESVSGAFETVYQQAGTIDVLVNNAGIAIGGPVEDLPLEDFRQVMETNYFGAIRCIKQVAAKMREANSGSIINISSVAGKIAIAPSAAYAASKFALEALSEALGQEMKAFNVHVALVEPGVIATPIFNKFRDREAGSPYPQSKRQQAFYAASLENPASPNLVGEKVKEIIESGTWQFRHPVGPDAEPFLGWRATTSDEDWINNGAIDDETWIEMVETGFGLKVRDKFNAL